MVRNGDLRTIKVLRKDGNRVVGKSRDDAHQYRITYYPKTQYNSRSSIYITIVFNKYRDSKRQLTKQWNKIEDVYENRQELLNKIWEQIEDFCKED